MASLPLYVSRLVKLSVLDQEGEQLGRVADVVVGAPLATRPPPVLGLVVTIPGRRIFLAITKVHRIDAEGVFLSTPSMNLRSFAARPAEVLVMEGLVDRRVTEREGPSLRIEDVAVAETGPTGRPWELAEAATTEDRSLGRRGPITTQSWEVLRPLLADVGDRWGHLRELHPVDIADRIAEMPLRDRKSAVESLDDEQLADLLEELPESDQAGLISNIALERAADVLEEMDPDDAADLLGELSDRQRTQLLAEMEPEEAAPVERLLQHDPDTAGGLMTPEPLILSPDATVAEALAVIRHRDIPSVLAAQVFVVLPPLDTPTGPLLGVASFQRMLRRPPGTPLGECVDGPIHAVGPDDTDEAVTRTLAAYDLLAVPVCDSAGRLLGAVTVDDVLDHVLPDDWRTFAKDDRIPRTSRRSGGRR